MKESLFFCVTIVFSSVFNLRSLLANPAMGIRC